MDKEKIKAKLKFLRPMDIEEENGRELRVEQMAVSGSGNGRGEKGAWKNRLRVFLSGSGKLYLAGALVIAMAAVLWGLSYYSAHSQYTEYAVISSSENVDINGTEYAILGKSIIKYSPDGVFCVDSHNESRWSAAYSMRTPVAHVCGKTMVLAEQQGTQVYVLNEKGVMGSFKTALPIIKAQVSGQGVVALILKEDEVAWIELFDAQGTELAKIKSTVEDSGYPLDVALSPNASRMMISYLSVDQGRLGTRIAFYDFSSAADSDESHLSGTMEYPGRVFPKVYYADSSTPVAVSDSGFVVFKNQKAPEERVSASLDKEILSCFHDENYIGFVHANEAADCRYEVTLYRYDGKRIMYQEFDCDYEEVRMDGGEILLYDAKNCTVYTAAGVRRFQAAYEKQVNYFAKLPGSRKYLVITKDSMDRIRIS